MVQADTDNIREKIARPCKG